MANPKLRFRLPAVAGQPQNLIPIALGGADKNVALPATVVMQGSGTDADGTIAGYAWRQVSGPAQLAGLPATTKDVSLPMTVVGTYVLGLITTDNKGAKSVEDLVTLIGYKEDPVVITPPPVVVVPPKLLSHYIVGPTQGNEGTTPMYTVTGNFDNNTAAQLPNSIITWDANTPNGAHAIPANSVVGDGHADVISATVDGRTVTLNLQVVDKTVVIPPTTGERVTGILPVDVNLDLISAQNPPRSFMAMLYTAPMDPPVQPEDFYGQVIYEDYYEDYHEFRKDAHVLVKEIWLGPYQGDLSSRYFDIYGERADGTRQLLVHYAPDAYQVGVPAKTPGKGYVYSIAADNYVRLVYRMRYNAKPWYVRVIAEYTPVAPYVTPILTKYELGGHTGTNGHPYSYLQDVNVLDNSQSIPADKLDLAVRLGNHRIYVDNSNIETFGWQRDKQGRNMDAMLRQLKQAGCHVVWVGQGITDAIANTYPNPGEDYERIPVVYGADRSNPASYQPIIDLYKQIFYRYGRNKTIDPALVKSQVGPFFPTAPEQGSATKEIGLGLLDEFEPYNEADKSWKGIKSFGDAVTMLTWMWALYTALKAIDPLVQISWPGLASFAPDLLRLVELASRALGHVDANGNTIMPCDRYPVHMYPSTFGSQYGPGGGVGVAVEGSFAPAYVARFQASNYAYLGGKPIDIGEEGYDCTQYSPLRAVVPTGSTLTQRQWAGVLYLRAALFNAKNGFERTYFYEWEDREILDQYKQFSAMGMTYQVGQVPNRKIYAYPVLYLLAQLRASFKTHKHVQEISTIPLVDRWEAPSLRTAYSLYMPTESNATGAYTLALPYGGVRYDFALDTYTPTTTALAAGSQVIQLTETPCFVVLNPAPTSGTSVTVTSTEATTTSAGVFDGANNLVRTLYNNQATPAGSQTISWDGTNDAGTRLAPGAYTLGLQRNKVKYEWEGARIGNTSTAISGPTRHKSFQGVRGMAISGGTAYYCTNYDEGWSTAFKFSLSDIQSRTHITQTGQSNQGAQFVATDGVLVYWAGPDCNAQTNTFIYATRCSDDSEVTDFPAGAPVATVYGRTYPSAIARLNTPEAAITGLAVQKNGNLLLVARAALNNIYVHNKATGELITTIGGYNNPRCMTFDYVGGVWLNSYGNALTHHTIDANGSFSGPNISLSSLVTPLDLDVSPDGAIVAICDGNNGSEVIRAYNTNDGSVAWTFGNGSYTTDPTVANDKFFFVDRNTVPSDTFWSFICFAPDGSFWVGDGGNCRMQHYAADRTFIDRIMYLPHSYGIVVDKNNPRKLINGLMEFDIDYSKELDQPGGWTLLRNYRGAVPDAFHREGNSSLIVRSLVTLSNRTYGLMVNTTTYKPTVIEFPVNAPLRVTPTEFAVFANVHIRKDGTLRRYVNGGVGNPAAVYSSPFSAVDASGNLNWGTETTIAGPILVTIKDPQNQSGVTEGQSTTSGKVIFFNSGGEHPGGDGDGSGFHLGAIATGAASWAWRTSLATGRTYTGDFPTDGRFDTGNGVDASGAGGDVVVLDNDIFWNYHGESWKGSQTNYWNHFADNGLMIGQFGDYKRSYGDESIPKVAGNVAGGSVVNVGGVLYLYHNDEGINGGVHRWKITGAASVTSQAYPLTLSPAT
jgi:hypothetical protein